MDSVVGLPEMDLLPWPALLTLTLKRKSPDSKVMSPNKAIVCPRVVWPYLLKASVRRLAVVTDEAHSWPGAATMGQALDAGAATRICAGVMVTPLVAKPPLTTYGDAVGAAELTAARAARMKEYCIFEVGK